LGEERLQRGGGDVVDPIDFSGEVEVERRGGRFNREEVDAVELDVVAIPIVLVLDHPRPIAEVAELRLERAVADDALDVGPLRRAEGFDAFLLDREERIEPE
jgi:hypothetical protein